MRKREQQDEKLMYEIAQENKRMSEPLRKAKQVRRDSAGVRKRPLAPSPPPRPAPTSRKYLRVHLKPMLEAGVKIV